MTRPFDASEYEGFDPNASVALVSMAMTCMKDSVNWFGDAVAYNVPHMMLGLCGEVGELANLIKKIDRGSISWDDPEVPDKVRMEITDCFIYLLNLASLTQTDLYKAFLVKRQENIERFGRKGSSNGTA
jgi:NTP pyrophosphatase (non-canonical NTP hydrolase)